MHNPKILILDEPTSGLDPVMQERFIQFILKEKSEGKQSSYLVTSLLKWMQHVIALPSLRMG